mmetsp:Transcript_7379/g.20924  ORF Transcript_7379/g.20924 Transcript_7379/m.20924 type:complete len:486 (-) Transcript_7379:425-1882(-)
MSSAENAPLLPTRDEPKKICDPSDPNVKVALLGCAVCCGMLVLNLIIFLLILYTNLNNFQAWSVFHPANIFTRMYQPSLSGIESFWAMNPLYLDQQREKYGNSFMVSGQVLLGDFDSVEKALTSPQARSTLLGASPLVPEHLPKLDNGDMSFLLALSDKDAGGNGNHEAFKRALTKVLFNHRTVERQDDNTSQKLLTDLGEEYVARRKNNTLNDFFWEATVGWMRFNVRYLHYVLLDLDPDDREATSLFTDAYYITGGPGHYIWFAALQSKAEGVLGQVASIYEKSPVMSASDVWGTAEANHLKKSEAARLLVSMMAIAALQGPFGLGQRALGFIPLPDYVSAKNAGLEPPSSIDMAKKWDELDLDDDEALELYLLETARLYAPVSATARVAEEKFTATVAGSEREFPEGTLVNVPIALANTDKEKWGETRYEFNPKRAHLKARSMAFNMVGDRDAGRGCPGRDVSIQMLMDVLREVGAARRAAQ